MLGLAIPIALSDMSSKSHSHRIYNPVLILSCQTGLEILLVSTDGWNIHKSRG